MQKTQNSCFKIATCEAFQRWQNATLQERGGLVVNHDNDGRPIYNKINILLPQHLYGTRAFEMSCLSFWCISTVKIYKKITYDIVTGCRPLMS